MEEQDLDMQSSLYKPEDKEIWDDFIHRSKNGTFLFFRDYMEYHSNRFTDHSLMFWKKGKCVALLPANIQNQTLYSHQGLTFGGLITDEKMRTPLMLELFEYLISYLKKNDIRSLVYKASPTIYHKYPAQEDLYALWKNGATLSGCMVTSSIEKGSPLSFSKRRLRGIKKGKNLQVKESDDLTSFHNLLSKLLEHKFQTAPTHTLEELILLQSRFPNYIRLFGSYKNDSLLAGVVIYETSLVAHTQYIAASDEGKECGALDALFDKLINQIYKEKPVFDFGNSNTEGGRLLNENLIDQKEEFGGRSTVLPTYTLEVNK